MKTLKKIIFGLLISIAGLILISFFLPKSFKVERSIVINATSEQVFNNVNDLNLWTLWNPWQNSDSTMVLTYFGPKAGVGATQQWTSKDGNGKLSITESIPFERVTFQYQREGMDPNDSRFLIESQGENAVKLTWTMEGDAGYNPIKRYFGLMMEWLIGADYENGLANIKTVSERL